MIWKKIGGHTSTIEEEEEEEEEEESIFIYIYIYRFVISNLYLSEMIEVEKVTTTVLIEKQLRDMAKARKISMSQVLNDALASLMAMPNSEEELILEENKVKLELEALQGKRAEIKETGEIRTKKKIMEEMQEDITKLKKVWVEHLNGGIKDNVWANLVTGFCNKWDVDRQRAMEFAEGRRRL